MTPCIYDAFVRLLGRVPDDETLRDLPVDSACGADCYKALVAGKAFADACDPTLRGEILDVVEHTVAIYWHG